jgi:urease accessory protein
MTYNAARLVPLFCLAFALPALAHTEHGTVAGGGFVAGLTHPLFGWDHVAAMVAVGLWGAFLGRPAIWLLPVVFPMVMALAAAAGVLGVPIPFVELGIAASAVVLGLLIVFAARPPLWVAAVVVGAFAIFHGHAHGTELPAAADPFAYAAGFVISTGLLHAAGIALGLLIALPRGELAIRGGGGVILLAGAGFLFGVL